jgi:hypothetical protein
MHDLTEARRIINELAAIRARLSVQDTRFLESWETALERRGAALPRCLASCWRRPLLRLPAGGYPM